jgi:uncharacterized protein (DUF2141 family)
MKFKVSDVVLKPYVYWPIIILFASLYLSIGIAHEALWFDESYSAAIVTNPILDVVRLSANDSHPPLYYVMLKLFSMVVGYGEGALRYLSVLGVLLMLGLAARPMTRAFGKKTGLIFGMLVLVSPMYFSMAQEMRMYTFASAFVTGSLVYGYLGVRDGKKQDLLKFSLFTVLASYTHYYALLGVTWINLMLFIWVLIWQRKSLKQYVIAALGAVLGFAPWIGVFWAEAGDTAKNFWIQDVPGYVILAALRFVYQAKFDFIDWSATLSVVLAGVMIGVGIALGIMKKDRAIFLPIAGTLTFYLTLLTGKVLSDVIRPIFVERYIFPVTGVFLIAVAFGVSKLKPKYLSIVVCVVFALLSSQQIYRVVTEKFNGPMREVVEAVSSEVQEGDVFIHDNVHTFGTFCYYFPNNKHVWSSHDPAPWDPNLAFQKNGVLVSDVKKMVDGKHNVWFAGVNVQAFLPGMNQTHSTVVDQFGFFSSGILEPTSDQVLYTVPPSWYGVYLYKAVPVDPSKPKKAPEFDPSKKGTIKIKVQGIKERPGKLYVQLFSKAGNIMDMQGKMDKKLVMQVKEVDIQQDGQEVVFENIPQGYYAVFVLHDENGNQEIDFAPGWMPEEGSGMTNNNLKLNQIPSFDQGKFLLNKSSIEETIQMIYVE